MTGSEILIKTLKKLGTEYIFGYPGGAVLSIFDELYNEAEMKFILTRHEQGAVHAADAYGRVTGKPGVCIATSGPGATNLVTGIMTAYMDSSPLIAITGQIPLKNKGLDDFQEVDIIGITMPIVKHSYSVEKIEDLQNIIEEAYLVASSGRPGPVLVDIPANIQDENFEYQIGDSPLNTLGSSIIQTINADKIILNEAWDTLVKAKAPVIIAGAGVVKGEASHKLREFAIKNNIPVAMSLLGLGCFSGEHPLSLGMGGIHGSARSHKALDEADVILALGVRFENRFTCNRSDFLQHAKVIHVDIDKSELGKTIKVDLPINTDINNVLDDFLARNSLNNEFKIYNKRMDFKSSKEGIHPVEALDLIDEKTGRDTIICTDVGQHQMWAAQYLRFREPRQFVTSGGAGTMGFGIPAALGAKLGSPSSEVITIVGDGGFQMTNQELTCLKDYDVPVKIIVFNNSCLGMVKQLQNMSKDGRHSKVHLNTNPDFVALAKAHGVHGERASSAMEFEEILDRYKGINEVVVIECIVDTNLDVYSPKIS